MAKHKPDILTREAVQAAHHAGRQVFASGKSDRANPYEPGDLRRQAWYAGFLDQWRWETYGPNEGETIPPL